MSFSYFEYVIMGIILLPGIIFAAYAQYKVNQTYSEYSKVSSRKNIYAKDAVKEVLDGSGLSNVRLEEISGKLTDHYDPTSNVVRLSQDIAHSTSVAALGIAMHEVGHAIQHNKGYFPAKLRSFAIRFSNITSFFLWPLVLIGIIFNFIYLDGTLGHVFIWAGIAFFGLAVLVNLVTLPVEFDASKRSVKILREMQILDEDEIEGCKKVLTAAALTYVAALIVSILNLLRFILVFVRRRD